MKQTTITDTIQEFRELLDKWGIIATPAKGAKKHTREMRKAWEQFLLSTIQKTREETIREMESNDCDCPFHKSDHEWCKSDKQKCGCKGTIFEVEQAYLASLKEKQIKV